MGEVRNSWDAVNNMKVSYNRKVGNSKRNSGHSRLISIKKDETTTAKR